MMSGLTLFLIPVGLLATVAFLTIGLFSMARGGGFSRDQSNK
ncbi:MAG: HIG1 domain-containing protein, partial [Marinicaulis sp.]|nr:HIG1 domain-containing protein [Marinicaulis sp.]